MNKKQIRKFHRMRMVSDYGDCPEMPGWIFVASLLGIFLLFFFIDVMGAL